MVTWEAGRPVHCDACGVLPGLPLSGYDASVLMLQHRVMAHEDEDAGPQLRKLRGTGRGPDGAHGDDDMGLPGRGRGEQRLGRDPLG